MKYSTGSDATLVSGHSEASIDQTGARPASQDHASEADELKRVEAALRRLDRGDFGHCLYCGDQISVKRLDRDPAIDSCGTCDEG